MLKALIVTVLVGAGVVPLAASADFTGQWVMNSKSSKYHPKPQPKEESYTIEQKDATSIKVRFRTVWPEGGASSGTFTYDVDGKERSETKKLDSGVEVKVTQVVQWDGGVLIVTKKIALPMNIVMVEVDKWSISADGSQLTIINDTHSETSDGKTVIVVNDHPNIVFDRLK